jgi:transcriptional regulator with XRE-family HTH domain
MNVSDTIEKAIANGMSQRELARLTGESEQHISGFKKGTRPCSYQRHAQIAAAAGLQERATRILLEGMAESLDDNSPHEKQAKAGLLAMLQAFPEEQPTITAAPHSKGATARGVATDKSRLRKTLRT